MQTLVDIQGAFKHDWDNNDTLSSGVYYFVYTQACMYYFVYTIMFSLSFQLFVLSQADF